jgi:pimeloyl-ACP methyl ester carboxylesterase
MEQTDTKPEQQWSIPTYPAPSGVRSLPAMSAPSGPPAGLQTIPVDGGDLAVEVLPGSSEPVLAIHGISSSRKLWTWLRAEAPDLTLVAPDLRGRGDSVDVAGPSSVPQHADDMIAVLDALGLDAVHVCGMSMGGFIAVELAHRFPTRVKSLILVDGGFPMAAPAGLTREMVPAVFADRLARLEQRFDSTEAYAEFFTSGTAPLLDPTDPLLLDYLEHDLRDGKVRLSGPALIGDAESVFFGETPWEQLALPVRFLYAEWGGGPNSPPAYPAAAVARYASKAVSLRYVEGADHAGSIMTKAGASATAELIFEALA